MSQGCHALIPLRTASRRWCASALLRPRPRAQCWFLARVRGVSTDLVPCAPQVQRQHDPTLPPPWEALFDPASGLKYFWNPQTNVTQYERPAGSLAAPPMPSSYVRPQIRCCWFRRRCRRMRTCFWRLPAFMYASAALSQSGAAGGQRQRQLCGRGGAL